jgi:hypothetical protein
MVRQIGENSNTIFEILEDWEAQLRASKYPDPGLEP